MRLDDDSSITFQSGICNHCRRYDELLPQRVVDPDHQATELRDAVARIKAVGKSRSYDCIVGVSGGVDSTYVAKKAVELGLRPLAVHVDNGWNSEAAVSNIENSLLALDLDLYTEVLDLEEFYDLQQSFLRASVPDGDIPADHAIQAVLWKIARRKGVQYILSGMNFRTEAISVPSWSYGHSDWRYIRGVHRRHGNVRLKSYPHYGFTELFYTNIVRGIRIISLLNYLDYDREQAKEELQRDLDWTPYGGKHYESIYTRYYQGYVLPTKFCIDKRRGHLSDLINSAQLSRKEALEQLREHDYEEDLRQSDEELFLKKLRLDRGEYEKIMAQPSSSFRSYPNSYDLVQRLRRSVNWLRLHGWYPK